MGIPFFLAFHTLFDEENHVLSFYPMDEKLLIKGGWKNAGHFFVIGILGLIYLLFVFVVVVFIV